MYLVHCLDVVDAHEVEAETVDMIFLDPILHALLHKVAHQLFVGCRLVAAARAVGIFAFGCLAEVIVGIGLLEIRSVDVEGMVVHDVEDDTDASLM